MLPIKKYSWHHNQETYRELTMSNFKKNLFASTMTCLALSACQAPNNNIVVSGYPAQELTPSTSVLSQTCNGTHDTKGLNVRGQSLTLVKVMISEVTTGKNQDFAAIIAPADTAYSRWTKAVYTGLPGKPSCGGLSLNTIVLNRSSGWLLRWEMEMSEVPGAGFNNAWRTSGEFPITDGIGSQEVPFVANGRSFVAKITSEQGPLWRSMEIQRRADEEGAIKYKSFGRELPDEKQNRTLEDMMRK